MRYACVNSCSYKESQGRIVVKELEIVIKPEKPGIYKR